MGHTEQTEAAETVEIAGQAVARHYGDAAAEYLAAQRGAVAIWRGHEGRVNAVGRDRLDLLHRMSTNDVNGIPAGAARPTVLTTPVARMVDLLWVLNRGDRALCLTGPGRATGVRRWLAGYTFYNDQVKFEDVSQALGQFALFGPGAPEAAEAVLAGAGALEEDYFVEQDDTLVLRARPLAGAGFTVIAPAEALAGLWRRALAAGATPAGEDAFQMLRIKAGQPYSGHEITDGYIPLEANLWPAVSFNKGCYVGQEIIARMESRGKLARRLVGLRLAAPAQVGDALRGVSEGATLGSVTSTAVLPDLGPVALAFVKTAFAEPGTRVLAGETQAEVVGLPFQ